MVLTPSETTSFGVYPTYPPLSLFQYSPLGSPHALNPPASDHTFARPFDINPELYNNLLHVAWPITISLVYAATVNYVNGVNRRRENKPWAFSKTLTFYILVVAHNVFLAIYSGWTFMGMLNAIKKSWPGLDGPYGYAGAADALCKMHGPRGLGSAATYNASTSDWGYTDRAIQLADGSPDATDVGRIWNEGLAFYGWLFYLSKFYEVLDTAIILTKGKQSSRLQTFHHAGAMFCLWSGIRYMSPPIWMFTFINSGLHTLMYSYYTLSALTIRVPTSLKRTLTFLQIFQIIFGASYALAHLFVAYDIPISSPYLYVHNLSTALPSAASTVSSAVASVTASANIGSWLKKAALRAAGEEGLAENVRNARGEPFGIDAVHAAQAEKAQEEIRYSIVNKRVHCLDTSGEVFAILLNVLYLAPLACLFISFFYQNYVAGTKSGPPKPTIRQNIKKSGKDAGRDASNEYEKELQEAMEDRQGGPTEPPPEQKAKLEKAKSDTKQRAAEVNEKMQNDLKMMRAKAQKSAGDAKEDIKSATQDLPAKAQKGVEDLSSKAKKGVQNASDAVKDKAQSASQQAGKKADEAGKKVDEVNNSKNGSSGKGKTERGVNEIGNDAQGAGNVKKGNGLDADASAYEIKPDEPKTLPEKKAEEKMQPKQK